MRAHGREPQKRGPEAVRPPRASQTDTSSEEELGDDDIIYATDASDMDDAPVTINRSSVSPHVSKALLATEEDEKP